MKFFPGFSVFCKLFFQLILFKKLFLFQCRVTSENTDEGGERFQFPQCCRHFRIFLIAQKVDVEEISQDRQIFFSCRDSSKIELRK